MKAFNLRTIGVIAGLAAMATLLLAFAVSSSATLVATCSGETATASNFEIDTNANLKVDGAAPCIDWLSGGSGTAFRSGVLAKGDKPTGSTDDSFGQGTAENNPNPTIVDGSIPPNKSDLKTFGVFSETTPNGDKFLELFWSRVQNPSGTTNMDFELNQLRCAGTSATCAQNGSSKNPLFVTPKRLAGDKLITYDLSRGGTNPTISVRSWSGSAWGPAVQVTGSARASVNTSQIPASESGGLGILDPFTFGELAISYADIFSGNQCGSLGSAYLKSRSSDSFSSEIKDFIAPEPVTISNCASIVTDATDEVTIGNSISDTATLSLVGAGAGGTITFDLYSDAACTTKVTTLASTTAVNGPGTYTSVAYTPTAVGTYYWIAHYSGDASNSPANGTCGDANESSVVNKKQPAISTSASGPVTIGDSISDTATLIGATSDAGGTITFKLYTDALCQTEIVAAGSTATVTGNGSYTSGSFTPTAVGTYYWIASYGGDAKNESVSGACGDANESSVVNKKQPGISTTASGPVTIGDSISDTATLTGATSDAGGTITFKLYTDALCQTEIVAAGSTATVTGNGSYTSGSFTPTAVGTYYWIASYGGDAKNESVSGTCGDANESSVVNKAASSISTTQRFYPNDTATIGGGGGGTVTFKLYGPNNATCDPSGNSAVYTETVSVTSGSASTTNTGTAVTTDGTYRWLVTYSGDASHFGRTSACGAEQFTLAHTDDSGPGTP